MTTFRTWFFYLTSIEDKTNLDNVFLRLWESFENQKIFFKSISAWKIGLIYIMQFTKILLSTAALAYDLQGDFFTLNFNLKLIFLFSFAGNVEPSSIVPYRVSRRCKVAQRGRQGTQIRGAKKTHFTICEWGQKNSHQLNFRKSETNFRWT